MLPVVGEVQAEQLGVAARAQVPHVGGQPHHLAAERDGDVAQHRVFTQLGVVHADVYRVVGPVGEPHHGEPGGGVDDEFDVVGQCSAAPVVDDDHRLGELGDPDLQVPVGHRTLAGAGDGDSDRLGDTGVALDGDQGCGVERRKCLRGNTVGWDAALAEPLIAAAQGLDPQARLLGDADLGFAGGPRRAVVQATQPAQRGEPPDFVAAVRDLERVHIERGEDLALVGRGQGRALNRFSQVRH